MARSQNFQVYLIKKLKDPQEALCYFKAILEECKTCSEEESQKLILQALKNITNAQGGISELSAKTKLGRPSLYKTLSPKGNPKLSTILTIANALLLSPETKRSRSTK